MHLKRTAKSLALSAALSRMGSSDLVSRTILRGVRLGYEPSRGTALACVSVDFDVTRPERFQANREGTRAILEVAETHDIPITWAICGDSAEKDSKSYDAIMNSTQEHEIAVHTYSHLDATKANKEEFRADIFRCLKFLGIESPRTFVFPWNREAHFDVLRELGFRAYRGPNRAIGPPIQKEGLWNVRPVYYVDHQSNGAGPVVEKYLRLCVERGGVFHLWSHPWSIVENGSSTLKTSILDPIFRRMAELRQQSKLFISTMGGIAYLMESNSDQKIALSIP